MNMAVTALRLDHTCGFMRDLGQKRCDFFLASAKTREGRGSRNKRLERIEVGMMTHGIVGVLEDLIPYVAGDE